MIDDQFTPDEQVLIEQLQNAPQPALKPAAFDAIRQRMFEAMDNPLPPQPSQPGGVNLPRPVFIALTVGLIGLVTVIIILAAILLGGTPASSVSPTSGQTPTQIESTGVTISPAVTSTTIQLSNTPSASDTPDSTATQTPMANPTTAIPIPSEELTLTGTPSDIQDMMIVVEGPVSDIQLNVITIYDLEIVLQPDDPILSLIQIGDEVRVEGVVEENEGVIVVVAVTVTSINVEVFVGDNGQVWRDSGDCSNPPPDWAPANGWRRRCEGGGGNSGGGNNGQGGNPGGGNGRGRGNNDDDDD